MTKVMTLALIEDGDRVLLAMKKQGFGAGWWNGFGGKVEAGESIEDAVARELKEESGLVATSYKKRGVINFFFDGSDKQVEMHIFEITSFKGVPTETDEMAPKWFLKSEIPYEQMWPADRGWLELYFAGNNVEGSAHFDAKTDALVSSDFKIVSAYSVSSPVI